MRLTAIFGIVLAAFAACGNHPEREVEVRLESEHLAEHAPESADQQSETIRFAYASVLSSARSG